MLENLIYQAIAFIPSKKDLFKKSFLRYHQRLRLDLQFFFEPSLSLEKNPGGFWGVFFHKVNLLKVIRLILNVYNSEFWDTLNPKQKYKFCNKIAGGVVGLTLKAGSYRYINSLFLPIIYAELNRKQQ